MKKQLIFVIALISFTGAAWAQEDIPSAQPGMIYGKSLSEQNAINVSELSSKLATDSIFRGQIVGEVVSVCKTKGCYITLKQSDKEDPITVRFKDYGFFLPQDALGKTIVLEGQARIQETTVEQLRHAAEDEGRSPQEIEKITEPKVDIRIIADGVLVKG